MEIKKVDHRPHCPHCGGYLAPQGVRGRSKGYIPDGSLPSRVIAFLHAHPEVELTATEVSVRMDDGRIDPDQVRARLARALRYGYIEIGLNRRGKRVYRAPALLRDAAAHELELALS